MHATGISVSLTSLSEYNRSYHSNYFFYIFSHYIKKSGNFVCVSSQAAGRYKNN